MQLRKWQELMWRDFNILKKEHICDTRSNILLLLKFILDLLWLKWLRLQTVHKKPQSQKLTLLFPQLPPHYFSVFGFWKLKFSSQLITLFTVCFNTYLWIRTFFFLGCSVRVTSAATQNHAMIFILKFRMSKNWALLEGRPRKWQQVRLVAQ